MNMYQKATINNNSLAKICFENEGRKEVLLNNKRLPSMLPFGKPGRLIFLS